MENYKIFDTAWEPLGIDSEVSYIKRFIIKGKFNPNVPKRIINEFETVVYLMAFAYYRIELYNEAFNKCMRLMEMSLKLKAKQIGIDTKFQSGKEKNLNTLINEICQNSYFVELKNQLDWFRKLRNMEMHPEEGSYLGAYLNHTSKFKLFVNIINHLFNDSDKLDDILNHQNKLKATIEKFDKEYYTALIDNKKYLIKKVVDSRVISYKEETALVLIIAPVLTDAFEYLSKYTCKPLGVIILNYSVDSNSIKGVTLNGNSFELITDNKRENLSTVTKFDNDVKGLGDISKINYEMSLKHDAVLEIINLTYAHSYN